MFKRLLVPLDGSQLAESVLQAVKRLAVILDSSITLLHVIEKRPPSSIHGDTHLRDPNEAQAYLAGIERQLKGSNLRVDVHVHTVPQGDVPKCIAEHACELEQDLIVLCRHGAGGVRRFVFGSNAEQVLSHGTTPVLLIQSSEEGQAMPTGPERILALVDNTRGTKPALDAARELATLASAQLDLLVVVPTLASMSAEQAASGRLIPSATREILELSTEDAVSWLRGEVNSLVGQHIATRGRVERGDAAATVVHVAHETRSDLVILAVRGQAGLSAFFAETITSKIADSYDGAMLLIPRG